MGRSCVRSAHAPKGTQSACFLGFMPGEERWHTRSLKARTCGRSQGGPTADRVDMGARCAVLWTVEVAWRTLGFND
eukprot:886621-Prorocentrum_minimum.AAC.1